MAGLSDYLEAKLLNLMRGTAIAVPTNVYLALYTADPTDAGTGAEVSGGAYARQPVTAATGTWSAPSASGGDQAISNSNVIAYPTATVDWGTITHVGLKDAATGGNLLWSGALDASRTVTNGTTFSFNAGDVTLKAG